jgi:signal transduction histidine kinase
LLWLSGLWIAPLWLIALWASWPYLMALLLAASLVLAPVPALLFSKRCESNLRLEVKRTSEELARLKLHLETIRYRTGRLREELSAADRQARFSHQLTLLGQFTAGFLHEFNNPLAILTNRIEVLLEERQDDPALAEDLRQMLKEARYMGSIAGTLLRALHRERGNEPFDPCIPSDAVPEVLTSVRPFADKQGVKLILEAGEVPRVNVPSHAVVEVIRTLITNAIEACSSTRGPTVWVRLEPYRGPGSKVILRVEDNGPGVPEGLQAHLFEPFASRSTGKGHLGLGLFLAGSLLDTYDGSVRYEPRAGGGACFVVEMPPARFTREQPYHWFVKDTSGL